MKELEGLEENEVFNYGLLCGIKLFQQKIVTAHKRKEHLMIDGNIYIKWLQRMNARKRLL